VGLWPPTVSPTNSGLPPNISYFYAMLSVVYAVVVCLCVCLSVTLRYCIKMAKHRTTQMMPHDSPGNLAFWHQRSRRNSNGITPYGGDKCRWCGIKLATFEEKRIPPNKAEKYNKPRKYVANLAYSPLCAVVSPPSEYLW